MNTRHFLEDYRKEVFAAKTQRGDRIVHEIYSKGDGPPVILIQELPGIGEATFRLADTLCANGFKVILPHLFGPIGKLRTVGNMARVFCMRREFHLFAKNHSSPIVDWLKALCAQVRTEEQVEGVGVIGMCLTGNFAISLMADNNVLAAVASQPSLPLTSQSALHMSPDEIDAVKARIDTIDSSHGSPLKVFRFSGDWMCSQTKLDAIDACFNEPNRQRVHCGSLPGHGHSVLTVDFVDQVGHPTHTALQSVLDYFGRQLTGNGHTPNNTKQ